MNYLLSRIQRSTKLNYKCLLCHKVGLLSLSFFSPIRTSFIRLSSDLFLSRECNLSSGPRVACMNGDECILLGCETMLGAATPSPQNFFKSQKVFALLLGLSSPPSCRLFPPHKILLSLGESNSRVRPVVLSSLSNFLQVLAFSNRFSVKLSLLFLLHPRNILIPLDAASSSVLYFMASASLFPSLSILPNQREKYPR